MLLLTGGKRPVVVDLDVTLPYWDIAEYVGASVPISTVVEYLVSHHHEDHFKPYSTLVEYGGIDIVHRPWLPDVYTETLRRFMRGLVNANVRFAGRGRGYIMIQSERGRGKIVIPLVQGHPSSLVAALARMYGLFGAARGVSFNLPFIMSPGLGIVPRRLDKLASVLMEEALLYTAARMQGLFGSKGLDIEEARRAFRELDTSVVEREARGVEKRRGSIRSYFVGFGSLAGETLRDILEGTLRAAVELSGETATYTYPVSFEPREALTEVAGLKVYGIPSQHVPGAAHPLIVAGGGHGYYYSLDTRLASREFMQKQLEELKRIIETEGIRTLHVPIDVTYLGASGNIVELPTATVSDVLTAMGYRRGADGKLHATSGTHITFIIAPFTGRAIDVLELLARSLEEGGVPKDEMPIVVMMPYGSALALAAVASREPYALVWGRLARLFGGMEPEELGAKLAGVQPQRGAEIRCINLENGMTVCAVVAGKPVGILDCILYGDYRRCYGLPSPGRRPVVFVIPYRLVTDVLARLPEEYARSPMDVVASVLASLGFGRYDIKEILAGMQGEGIASVSWFIASTPITSNRKVKALLEAFAKATGMRKIKHPLLRGHLTREEIEEVGEAIARTARSSGADVIFYPSHSTLEGIEEGERILSRYGTVGEKRVIEVREGARRSPIVVYETPHGFQATGAPEYRNLVGSKVEKSIVRSLPPLPRKVKA